MITIYIYSININTLKIESRQYSSEFYEDEDVIPYATFDEERKDSVYAESSVSSNFAKQLVFDMCRSLANKFAASADKIWNNGESCGSTQM